MFRPQVRPAEHDGEAMWICIHEGAVLIGAGLPEATASPVDGRRHHLGLLREQSVWAIDVEERIDHDDHEWIPLRSLYGRIPDDRWVLAGRAQQIITWDRDHRFCGRCGTVTDIVADPVEEERARRCPSCGLRAYPRLAPAVIMLVRRGDEVLLAHGRQFPGRFYSALAGFVEPGETLEQAVVREVKEEVAIDIGDVRYFGSQPWPFPHSLMVGFTARWEAGEIDPDPREIVDAGWYRRDELPPAPIGGMSIAGWMVEAWLEGRLD
ncbi:MAG: NAD(+) diphosphatase [Actinomycetota bacterium]